MGEEKRQNSADQRHGDDARGQKRVSYLREVDEQKKADKQKTYRHHDPKPRQSVLQFAQFPDPLQPVAAGHLHLFGDPLLSVQHGAAEVATAHAELDRNIAFLIFAVDERGARHQLHIGDIT